MIVPAKSRMFVSLLVLKPQQVVACRDFVTKIHMEKEEDRIHSNGAFARTGLTQAA